MTYTLRILRPTAPSSPSGAEAAGFEALYESIFAARERITGSRAQQLGEMFAAQRVNWQIWDCYEVQEGWRVETHEGETYTVVAVLPDRLNRMLTLVTDRTNL